MDKRYKHLNGEERGVILAEHGRGASLGAIGALLGRSASTVGRELRRGRPEGDPAQPYCAQRGGDRYRVLRERCGRPQKLVKGGWLHDFVRGKLVHRRWSPEQIASRLKSMDPDDPTRLISHETIHAAICAQAEGRAESRDDRSPATSQAFARACGARRSRAALVPTEPEHRRLVWVIR